jgi:hypothetical protein
MDTASVTYWNLPATILSLTVAVAVTAGSGVSPFTPNPTLGWSQGPDEPRPAGQQGTDERALS